MFLFYDFYSSFIIIIKRPNGVTSFLFWLDPLNLCEQISGNKRYYNFKSLNYAHCLRAFSVRWCKKSLLVKSARNAQRSYYLKKKNYTPSTICRRKLKAHLFFPCLGLPFTLNRQDNGAFLKMVLKPEEFGNTDFAFDGDCNFSGVVSRTENISCVFEVNAPFSNFTNVMLTRP